MSKKTFDEYTVKPGDSFWSIAAKHKVDFGELKSLNKGLGANDRLPAFELRDPSYGISPGDVVRIPRKDGTPTNPELNMSDTKEIGETKVDCKDCCVKYDLKKPFLIAIARQPNISAVVTRKIDTGAGTQIDLGFGQDITFGTDRALPDGYVAVEGDEDTLKDKIDPLITVFAWADSSKMAKRLFDKFRKKNTDIEIYTDADLNKAVAASKNFRSFSSRVLAAPGTDGANPSKPRIHQLLAKAGWDINKVPLIDDLGAPALNVGSTVLQTGDWGNGLALTIDAVLYVLVAVTDYHYDSCEHQYTIQLQYLVYDVFGLDDADLRARGADSKYELTTLPYAITAWWELQHQHGYPPLITKVTVTRTFTATALN